MKKDKDKLNKEVDRELRYLINNTIFSMHQMDILTGFDSDKVNVVNCILQTYKDNLLEQIKGDKI